MFIKLQLLLALAVLLNPVLCKNILFLSPLASPSHHIWNRMLSMGLIEKGHNITMLSHDKEKGPTKNFTVITIEGVYERLRESFKMEEFAGTSTLMTIKAMQAYAEFVCNYDMDSKGLATLLNYPKDFKFDLIIYDVTIIQCWYPLIERFDNPPVVGVTAFLLPPLLSYTFGNHLHTSYMPFYSSEFTNNMNLQERVLNFIYTYAEIFIRNYLSTPVEFAIAKKRFGDNIRPFEEIERNISLLLSNTDPVLNYPIALPPNIIPVGGLQIKPAAPLPSDLKKIMDGAKHGVILFSLGSNVRSADLKTEQRQAFIDAFARLPQIVLWKFELDALEGLPKNVIIRKWLPQNDILGHSNTRLFLSHGGALSTQEATYHGIPVIGIPFFGDQHINVRRMKEKGIAEHLDILQKLTADQVYEKIQNFLNSDKYTNHVRLLSNLYRDQPQTAMERAIFWIEYVIRHGTAEHLVLAARDMPSYQTSNMDVAAIFALVAVLIYSLVMLIVTCCRCIFTVRPITKPKSVK